MNSSFFTTPPMIMAHRGDSARFPENTLPAFLSAKELGVDVLETDVHLTADGKVVIWHDDNLDRGTNGSGIIEDHTLAELLTYDAGYNFSHDNGKTYPFRNRGITMLPFERALKELPDIRFNVDLKTDHTDLAEAFGTVVRLQHAENRILCASFHAKNLQYIRKTYPELATSMSRKDVISLMIRHKFHLPIKASMIPGDAFQIPEYNKNIKLITPRFIKQFHKLGVYIHVWTINHAEDMHRLLDMGVDGIFTDDPRLLIQVVAERKRENV